MKSDDPSTQALRQWALDKEKQYPGADGSIAVTGQSFDFMAWGGAHILPRKGDTLLPPDEKMRHGEVEYVGFMEEGMLEGNMGKGEGVGGQEGGEKKKKRLSGLFHRKEKEHKEGKGEEGVVIR